MATETQAEVERETEAETDPDDAGLSDHRRGVVVTTLASLTGIAAAFGSGALVGTTPAAATDARAAVVAAGAIGVGLLLMRLFGVEVEAFGVKDHLYVAFMTITLWFITFAILLTTGVTL